MAQGSWDRCKITGLPIRRLDGVHGKYLLEDGSLDVSQWPDCNVFVTSSITAAAGFTNQTRGAEYLLSDSRFHYHPILDMDGGLVTRATHSTSAEWMGVTIRDENEARRLANLRQNQS